ncbi:DUF1254 domain-containing protein [Nocardia tengchongensis]|uniref:DUF1254 domain-containing protein n=1 Tax=Nocardia tengchongensis TaxID=2055889 RepID=UPI0036B8BBF0
MGVGWLAAAALVIPLAACGSSDSSSDSVSTTASSPPSSGDSLRDTARDAYLFAFPVVMNYRTMYRQAIEGDHAFGKWLHLGQSTPDDKDIVTPNNDTPYSYAWVDLRAEPWVLTVPAVEPKRYVTSQWDDLWGFVVGNPGSVQDGNDGVTVMLAAPDWNGDKPDGVARVIKGESQFLGSLTRTQALGTDDGMTQVREIQDKYRLQPLSAYQHNATPAAAAPAIQWPTWHEGDEKTAKFWNYFTFMLPYTTNNPVDQPMYDKLAQLGITRDKPFDPAALDPKVRDALAAGVTDGQNELQQLTEGDVDSAKIFGSREQLGTDYTDRAVGVFGGMFGNVATQAVYFNMPVDSGGQALDGSKASYSVTFPPGGQPPAKYFWSFTMYDLPDRHLVANPINRYSLGSSTPGTKTNPDGSLTVYISAKSPGADKESNWLPAPEGPFYVVLRTYGPEPAILDHSWRAPKVTKQG